VTLARLGCLPRDGPGGGTGHPAKVFLGAMIGTAALLNVLIVSGLMFSTYDPALPRCCSSARS
jgi:hypothetical protein